MGYRYALLPWGEMFREGPLFYALNPYELLMENEYHLSIDGVYIMTWYPVVNSSVPKTDIEFECTMPAAVSRVDKVENVLRVSDIAPPLRAYPFCSVARAAVCCQRPANTVSSRGRRARSASSVSRRSSGRDAGSPG